MIPRLSGRDDKYLLRTNADGTRQASWRYWVLVWVVPVCFAGAVVFLALQVLWVQQATQVTEGKVVKVYEWDNDAPKIFYPGDKIYSPVWRYTWTDGTQTDATAGASHTDWNFPLGTKRQIRFYPDRKDNVVLMGPSEWWVVHVIAWIMAGTAVISGLVTLWTRRWLRQNGVGWQA